VIAGGDVVADLHAPFDQRAFLHGVRQPGQQVLDLGVGLHGQGDIDNVDAALPGLIHEVGEIARQFDRMAAALEAQSRSRQELFRNISHELRAPLARLSIAVELLEREDIGALAVIDGTGLVGVVSERDIVRRCVLARGDAQDGLTLQTAYNASDFFFDTDERNQLAGVPRHWLQGRLTYAHPVGIELGATLTWMPERTPTDHANTVYQDAFALWGARISYQTPASWLQGGRVTIFAEAQNLGDVTYASSYLVRDRVPDPPPPALTPDEVTTFIPGRSRSLRIGLTAGW